MPNRSRAKATSSGYLTPDRRGQRLHRASVGIFPGQRGFIGDGEHSGAAAAGDAPDSVGAVAEVGETERDLGPPAETTFGTAQEAVEFLADAGMPDDPAGFAQGGDGLGRRVGLDGLREGDTGALRGKGLGARGRHGDLRQQGGEDLLRPGLVAAQGQPGGAAEGVRVGRGEGLVGGVGDLSGMKGGEMVGRGAQGVPGELGMQRLGRLRVPLRQRRPVTRQGPVPLVLGEHRPLPGAGCEHHLQLREPQRAVGVQHTQTGGEFLLHRRARQHGHGQRGVGDPVGLRPGRPDQEGGILRQRFLVPWLRAAQQRPGRMAHIGGPR
ncbi:hypothetical protein RB199_33180 [Streptomyces libani]